MFSLGGAMSELNPSPFLVKDCVLSTISTGEHAGTLIEFRDKLATIHESCIYHHFWGVLLRPMFSDPEYHNDFAVWAHQTLQDDILAERLGILDPMTYKNLEELRAAVLEVVETRLDEREIFYWSKKRESFHFIHSKIIIFSTPYQIQAPLDLITVIPTLSTHSIFYHIIDAKRRLPDGLDDISLWLMSFGDKYQELIHQIRNIDPYFFSLPELKKELVKIIKNYFIKE